MKEKLQPLVVDTCNPSLALTVGAATSDCMEIKRVRDCLLVAKGQCVRACTRACVHACLRVCMYVRTYERSCVCACMHACVHTCMHVREREREELIVTVERREQTRWWQG